MIKTINISNRKDAKDVLNVQIPSYKVEAEIIGSYELPPLRDTVNTLQNCDETFIGYYENNELCGVISIKLDDEEIDIHRLIVHPNHFRKGIAQLLLNFIESKFEVDVIKVATGSKNAPAISFYKKNGFEEIGEVKVNDKLSLTLFEKKLKFLLY